MKDIILRVFLVFVFKYWKLILKSCSRSALIHLRFRRKELKDDTFLLSELFLMMKKSDISSLLLVR